MFGPINPASRRIPLPAVATAPQPSKASPTAAPPQSEASGSARRWVAFNGENNFGSSAKPSATPAQEKEIQRVMKLLKDPNMQALLVKDKGAVASAGILSYFQGQGGIRTLSNQLGGLDFYFKQPHAANLEAITDGVMRGDSTTPGLFKVRPALVDMAVGSQMSYSASKGTLADGRDKTDTMGERDQNFYPLIGGWTVHDSAQVAVKRPNADFFEVTVKSASVAIDKYNWNTTPNDSNLVTTLNDVTTGQDVNVNHAQMVAAKKFGAKDFWLAGALSTETVYRVPARAMQDLVISGRGSLSGYKVSERASPITEPAALRAAVTQAYLAHGGKARSAPVPSQSEVMRPLAIPATPAQRPEDRPTGGGGGIKGIKPTNQ